MADCTEKSKRGSEPKKTKNGDQSKEVVKVKLKAYLGLYCVPWFKKPKAKGRVSKQVIKH